MARRESTTSIIALLEDCHQEQLRHTRALYGRTPPRAKRPPSRLKAAASVLVGLFVVGTFAITGVALAISGVPTAGEPLRLVAGSAK